MSLNIIETGLGAKLFCNNFEGNVNSNVLVKLEGCNVLSEFLNGLFQYDNLAVNSVTCLFECFGNLDVVN